MKWQRVWEQHYIIGYTSGEWNIVKETRLEEMSCDITEQGSERCRSWALYRGQKFLAAYGTLGEAKQAAAKGRIDDSD
jgi:hypothetical protein